MHVGPPQLRHHTWSSEIMHRLFPTSTALASVSNPKREPSHTRVPRTFRGRVLDPPPLPVKNPPRGVCGFASYAPIHDAHGASIAITWKDAWRSEIRTRTSRGHRESEFNVSVPQSGPGIIIKRRKAQEPHGPIRISQLNPNPSSKGGVAGSQRRNSYSGGVAMAHDCDVFAKFSNTISRRNPHPKPHAGSISHVSVPSCVDSDVPGAREAGARG